MATSREQPDSWTRDLGPPPPPEAAATSGSSDPRFERDEPYGGRHQAPDDPRFTTGSIRSERPLRSDVIPSGRVPSYDEGRATTTRTTRTRRGRAPLRRVKRTLKHVDPLSILKLSLFYYACFLLLWLVFVAVLYWVLSSVGLFETIENVQKVFGDDNLEITLWLVERWAFFIGLTFAVVASLANLFIAFLYNVGADIVGGVEMTFVEREL